MYEEPESTIHAAIYARVSTDDQVQGFSLETQIEACHAYARIHGLVVWQSHVFIDGGVSGAILERPALEAMREVVRSKVVQAVIVYDLDRLSRVLWHQCMLIEGWQKDGVQFHTVRQKIDDTPEGQLLRQVVGSFAEWERTKIRERMMRGKAKLIAKGLPNSHTAPYGYRWTKVPHASTLEIDEAETEVVRQIFRWVLEGRTIRSITQQLTRDRIPTRRAVLKLGTKKTPPWHWNRSSVGRMLQYEGYVGQVYAGKEKGRVKQPRENWIELSIPAIIDQETFDAVGQQLTSNKQRSKRNRKHVYLLSSATLRCGLCGGGMGGASHRRARTPDYVYYICNTHVSRTDDSHCRVFVPARVIEPLVWSFVEQQLTHPKTILEAIALAQQGGAEQRLEAQQRIDHLERWIIDKDREDARLIEAYQGGAMTVEELKRFRQKVAIEKQALIDERWHAQEALLRLGAMPPEPYALQAYLGFVQQHLKIGSLTEKHAVIDKLGLVVTWTPGQPVKIQGTVPSATAEAWCLWEDEIAEPSDTRVVLRQQILERIKELRDIQAKSYQEIADDLQAEGIPTMGGWGAWSKATVHHLYARHLEPPEAGDTRKRLLATLRQRTLERIEKLREVEGKTYQQIAEVLQVEGVPTMAGLGPWTSGAVCHLYARHRRRHA